MRRVRILMYHRVEYLNDDYNMQAVTPENFEKHMKYLHNNYDVLSLESSFNSWFDNGTRDAVIITFDDGYYDFLYNALPVLEKYNLPATLFISTENIDSNYENWTDNILRIIFSNRKQKDFISFDNEVFCGKLPSRNYYEKMELYNTIRKLFLVSTAKEKKCYEKYLMEWAGVEFEGRKNRRILTSEEIQKLARSNCISIGAHTVSHASLKALSKEEQEYEILESKAVLEKIIGRDIFLFSYPFGNRENYSDVTIELLKKAGFTKSVVAYPGKISKESSIYELPRFLVKNYDEQDFAYYLNDNVFNDIKDENGDEKFNNKPQVVFAGSLENDPLISDTALSIVIWGTGYWGKELYKKLFELKMGDRIIAFGDNDIDKCGKKLRGVSIHCIQEIKDIQCKTNCHILVKGKYDFEICKSLICEKVRNIHLIRV